MAMTRESRAQRAADETDPAVLDRPVAGPIAWRGADLRAESWRVPVPAEAMAELETMASAFAQDEFDVETLSADAFDWPAITELMVAVRTRLDQGIGLAVLDPLPMERWGERATRAIAWLLTGHLAPAIMQKWRGHRVYDVRDTGAKLKYGVRRSTTNLQQELHTDGSFLCKTPEFMGLACIRQAPVGGVSRLASLATAHNIVLERHRDLLPRLYRPFWWDRQAEHDPAENPSSWLPIFEWDGRRLKARYYDDYIRNGYRLANDRLGPEDEAALAAMREAVEDPANWIEFRLEPGQIEYCNNQLLAHGRTGFKDSCPEEGRLLLRFWLRSGGGIGLEADATVPA